MQPRLAKGVQQAGRDPERNPELSLVIPAYNEAQTISSVVQSWATHLTRLGIDYEMLAYDDGSSDLTGQILEKLATGLAPLVARRHANMGHGPTILRGYREARGEWVFQVDSDEEMSPEHFKQLWLRRQGFDLLLGCRKDRKTSLVRLLLTAGSRATVRVLFGRTVQDVNTPYRLIRRSSLLRMLSSIPADTFAPNVVMSGLAIRNGLSIHEAWIPHQGRKSGRGSLRWWRLGEAAVRSLVQTVAVAFRDWRSRRQC